MRSSLRLGVLASLRFFDCSSITRHLDAPDWNVSPCGMVGLTLGNASGYPFVMGIESMIQQTCQHCAHFVDDPASIEAEFPFITPFGSAYSSARGHAGICQELDRFMDPVLAQDCPSFAPRGQPDGLRMTRRSPKVSPPR